MASLSEFTLRIWPVAGVICANCCRAEFAKNRERGIADTACTMQVTQFYAAELVLGLEYMHAKVDSSFYAGTINRHV